MLKREHFLGWPLRRICCVAFWLWLLGSLFSIAAADYQAAWEVRIGSEADKYGGGCISGNFFSVSLYLDSMPPTTLDGFSFLLEYDTVGLIFVSAEPGQALDPRAKFSVGTGLSENCASDCPRGLISLSASKAPNGNSLLGFEEDTANGLPDSLLAELAKIKFYVAGGNSAGDLSALPIRFCWLTCEDNFITYGGRIHWALDGIKPIPGDLNADGNACDISDALLYARYFLYGEAVFGVDHDFQRLMSDANQDSVFLSLADLIYIVDVIGGKAKPFSLLPHLHDTAQITMENQILALGSGCDVGAALIVFEGRTAVQPLLPQSMSTWIYYDQVLGETRVLIFDVQGARIPAGNTPLLHLAAGAKIKSCEVAGGDGARMACLLM